MVQQVSGRRVPVVQAYAFGKYLGNLLVTFDDDGEVVATSGEPILLDHTIPQGIHNIHQSLATQSPAIATIDTMLTAPQYLLPTIT